jgi:hypothetical protein
VLDDEPGKGPISVGDDNERRNATAARARIADIVDRDARVSPRGDSRTPSDAPLSYANGSLEGPGSPCHPHPATGTTTQTSTSSQASAARTLSHGMTRESTRPDKRQPRRTFPAGCTGTPGQPTRPAGTAMQPSSDTAQRFRGTRSTASAVTHGRAAALYALAKLLAARSPRTARRLTLSGCRFRLEGSTRGLFGAAGTAGRAAWCSLGELGEEDHKGHGRKRERERKVFARSCVERGVGRRFSSERGDREPGDSARKHYHDDPPHETTLVTARSRDIGQPSRAHLRPVCMPEPRHRGRAGRTPMRAWPRLHR